MSDFWAQRLGRAQQVAPTPVAPASNQPWWAVQQASPTVPQQLPVVAVQQPNTAPLPGSVTGDGKVPFGDLLRQDGYTTEKAQSTKEQELCPDCGGSKYMSTKGHPNSMKKCFECGYNPRFSQSMAGVSGTGQNIPVRSARMQNPNIGAPPMGTIIQHIG